MRKTYKVILGLARIQENESLQCKKLDNLFFRMRLGVLLFVALQWYLELDKVLTWQQAGLSSFFLWLFFVVEYGLFLTLVKQKLKYIQGNWPVPLVIIFAIPLMLKPELSPEVQTEFARFCIIVWLTIPWLEVSMDSLSDSHLFTTLITAFFIVVISGIIMSGIDPAIKHPLDGIWWAWVTMSTVGYGDVVPVSLIGRAFAVALILAGLLLFAALTANFSAIFVKHRLKHNLMDSNENQSNVNDLMLLNKEILASLENVEKRINEIENKLN